MKRLTTVFSLMLMAAFALSACGAHININLFTADEVISQSYPSGIKRVTVDVFNGSIDVITGTDALVKVDVTKRGGGNSQPDAQSDLKNVEVTMTADGDTLRVIARRTDRGVDIGNSGASANIRVPAGTTLDLRTSNGKVSMAGPIGDTIVRTSNGGIEVKAATGQLDLTTSNGQINVNGGIGQLTLDTSNGGISITSDNVIVAARTSNGQISYTGALANGNHSFRSNNAGIDITLPSNTNFNVDANTSNGKITSDFLVSVSGSTSDSELRGSVGQNPAISIGLDTSNGNIDIRKSR
jgi:DUF4097 and DUF4098 domain-containing protein YvlB